MSHFGPASCDIETSIKKEGHVLFKHIKAASRAYMHIVFRLILENVTGTYIFLIKCKFYMLRLYFIYWWSVIKYITVVY